MTNSKLGPFTLDTNKEKIAVNFYALRRPHPGSLSPPYGMRSRPLDLDFLKGIFQQRLPFLAADAVEQIFIQIETSLRAERIQTKSDSTFNPKSPPQRLRDPESGLRKVL